MSIKNLYATLRQTSNDFRQSINNQTDFSLLLAKHVIAGTPKDKNLVFSPLSLHVVLAQIAAGSNVATRDQILEIFKSKSCEELNFLCSKLVTLLFADSSTQGGPCLSTANGVWVDLSCTLKSSYKDVVENLYKAASNRVDFQNKAEEARQEVNLWAEKQTNGLIKDVLLPGSVTDCTRLIFANALYFKGAWDEEFDPSMTTDHEFFMLNGSSVQVPFMTNYVQQFVCAFDDFKVLRLLYKQGEDERRFSMYFFLPDAKDGLPSLLEKVCSEPEFIERHLPHDRTRVDRFRIPKFKINFDFEANNVLKELGLELPFKVGNLTETVNETWIGERLFVSHIFHKSFIEVNEKGTEAAAVSVVEDDELGFSLEEVERPPPMDFVADHPFLFVIREDTTRVVLFVGQVLNPLS